MASPSRTGTVNRRYVKMNRLEEILRAKRDEIERLRPRCAELE
jgi:hypothetical protein